ncbi:hypothetical protein [Nocardia sp. NBC_00416]|uniref:hypothetical protein n=1 Tax=Nocardia sp. NBC_00416 TaxID=2975991 RepID=UPI002E205501
MRSLHPPAAVRVTRALVFAFVCVLVSAAGHTTVSGHSLSPSAITLATAAVTAIVWATAARQWNLLTITSGLIAAQGLLHLWFTIAPAPGTPHPDHSHALSDSRSPAMLAAHCAAAIACSLWLWCGERAVFALMRAVYGQILLPFLLLMTARPVTAAERSGLDRRGGVPLVGPGNTLLKYSMARRGPPLCSASFPTIR